MPPERQNPDKVTYFAETDYRSRRIKFGIRDDDRGRHMYIIGKTGMGKSTLLENLAIQDIQNGEGLCFIDPHGGTAETLLSYIPENRINDVIYFAPFDQEFPVGLNVMEDIGRDKRPLVASGLIGAFKKVWVDAWSARMEYLLSNALLALLEYPGSTLLGVNRIFSDKNFRAKIVDNVKDPSVKLFWTDEFAKYSDKFATEATAAIQNKIGQFSANPLIRNMVGQEKSSFDIREVMDKKKILIVNLSKGRLGEGNANLIGSMLITKIYLAAMSRADVGPDAVRNLPPFYLYVDEFQSFANESFADILSEARKYKLSLTIAHQYIEQMSEEVRAAVFGNVGTMVSFRVGAFDSEVLEKEYAPAFIAEDLVNLGLRQIYLKLMINGVGSSPFSATTLNRPAMPLRNFAKEVIDASRAQFARPRAQVEEDVIKWHEPIESAPREQSTDGGKSQAPETRKYPLGGKPPVRTTTSTTPQGASAASRAAMSTQGEPQVRSDAVRTEAPRSDVSTRPAQPPPNQPFKQQFAELLEQPQPLAQAQPAPEAVVPAVAAPTEVVSTPQQPSQQVAFAAQGTVMQQVPPVSSEQLTQPTRSVQEVQPVQSVQSVQSAQLSQPEQVTRSIQTEPARVPFVSPAVTENAQPPRTEERKSMTEERRTQSNRFAPPATPLSALKNNPKRDKGPSNENLSSLKQALEAALAAKSAPQAGNIAPSPVPSLPPQVTENRQQTAVVQNLPVQTQTIIPPPLSAAALQVTRPESAAPIAPPIAEKQAPPPPQPPPVERVYPRPALLESPFEEASPREIPEDVLKSVLAD